MKQLGLIVAFVLPLSVAAKAIQIHDSALLKRLAIQQSVAKDRNIVLAVEGNLRPWLDVPEIESEEDTELNQAGDHPSFSILDDTVFTTSTTLRKRMEPYQEDITTLRSKLSPNAPVFVPQSPQTTSPQQQQAGSARSPQGPSQSAAPTVPSGSSPYSHSSTLTPNQQALLDHIKAKSDEEGIIPKQSPSRQVNPSSPARPLTLSPSQQTLTDQTKTSTPPRAPTTTHPQLAVLDRIKDVTFSDSKPSFGRYLPKQSSPRDRSAAPPRDRQDSRFFPSPDQKTRASPKSPSQGSRDSLFDGRPPLTIKIPPPPQFHPETSLPSLPRPQPLSHQGSFQIPHPPPRPPYPGPLAFPTPPPFDPSYALDVPPPWHQQFQPPPFSRPPAGIPFHNVPPYAFHLGAPQLPSHPRPIPPPRAPPSPPPDWPYPLYPAGSPQQNFPHQMGVPPQGPPRPIQLGGSYPESPPRWPHLSGTSPQIRPHPIHFPGSSPDTPFRPSPQSAGASPPIPPRPFRQIGFRPNSSPSQIPSPRSPPPWLSYSSSRRLSPPRLPPDRPRSPPTVVVTPMNPQIQKNGQHKSWRM